MSLQLNRIIWTIWLLSTLPIPKSTATPLFGISGVSGTKTARSRTQILSGVRFTDDEDDGLFDPHEEATKCAKGSTFCERVETYPTAEFTSILKEENKYAEFFGTDLVNPITIGNRFGEDENEFEEELCASRVRLVYPQVGLRQDNTWRFIVNHSNYTQGVRVDECIHKRQCQMLQNFPLGYKGQCKQKYVYRQLVSIDEDGNTIKDAFKIPSCCQCVLIRTFGHRLVHKIFE